MGGEGTGWTETDKGHQRGRPTTNGASTNTSSPNGSNAKSDSANRSRCGVQRDAGVSQKIVCSSRFRPRIQSVAAHSICPVRTYTASLSPVLNLVFSRPWSHRDRDPSACGLLISLDFHRSRSNRGSRVAVSDLFPSALPLGCISAQMALTSSGQLPQLHQRRPAWKILRAASGGKQPRGPDSGSSSLELLEASDSVCNIIPTTP